MALATIPQFNNSIAAQHLWAIFCGLLILANALSAGTLLALETIRLRDQRQSARGEMLAG